MHPFQPPASQNVFNAGKAMRVRAITGDKLRQPEILRGLHRH